MRASSDDRAEEGANPGRARGEELLDVVRVMGRLRAPDGCPWDREQTHTSLRRALLEEAHEAIDAGDGDRLRDELGDLLLQVVFHAQIEEDQGGFTIDDVARDLVAKLVRRHPHVFGDVEAETPEAVVRNWDLIKQEEKGPHGVEEDIPPSLPALLRAYKVQRRAASRGFDWDSVEPAMEKVHEEIEELERAETPEEVERELGDLLFATVAVARKRGVDAESALRGSTRRFAERFESLASWAEREGVDLAGLPDEELLRRFRELRGSSG